MYMHVMDPTDQSKDQDLSDTMGMIRVLMADDHPLIRTGLRITLSSETDLQVVGEAKDGHEARRLASELEPDVLLLDLNMPGPPPEETVRFLHERCPEVKVLVLSAYDREDYVRNMTRAGVDGYVLKDEAGEVLAEAVRTVQGGGAWFSREVLKQMIRGDKAQDGQGLTDREREVLGALAKGRSNGGIAEDFGLSEQTVRNYVSRIYEKLGVGSRGEAIIWALEHGFDQA